jgi:hypothetical protein
MKVAIWLDDFRDPSCLSWKGHIEVFAPDTEQVVWVKSYDEFVDMFPKVVAEHNLVAVFFDNDLGGPKEGRHAFNWMEEYVREHNLKPFVLNAQTANSAARKELHLGFGALERFWNR